MQYRAIYYVPYKETKKGYNNKTYPALYKKSHNKFILIA